LRFSWDIADQKFFLSVTHGCDHGAVGAFVVFDVTQTTTFDSLFQWVHDGFAQTHRLSCFVISVGTREKGAKAIQFCVAKATELIERGRDAGTIEQNTFALLDELPGLDNSRKDLGNRSQPNISIQVDDVPGRDSW
jgi:GTPase SAR1 family protein